MIRCICSTFFAMGVVFAAASLCFAQVDPTFNPLLTSDAGPGGGGYVLAFQPDRKMIVRVANTVGTIIRINEDGSSDNSFVCGACDPDYASWGSVALQPDGKLILAGSDPSGRIPRMVRLNAEGSQDPTFSCPFVGAGFSSGAEAFAVQPDGRIFAVLGHGGPFHSGGQTLYRLNSDGSIDKSFASITFSAMFDDALDHFQLLPDGKLMLSGTHHDFGPLFRVNTDGTKDFAFSSPVLTFTQITGVVPSIGSFVIQADGKVAFAGLFNTVNGVARNDYARLNSNGSVDATFAPTPPLIPGGYSGFYIDAQSTGKLLISGPFTGTQKLYRYNLDGTLDNTFQMPSTGSSFTAWKIDALDRIVFTGNYNVGADTLHRLNPDGSADNTFNFNLRVPGSAAAAAVMSDGRITIAGDYQYLANIPRAKIARVMPDGSLDASFDPGTGFNVPPSILLAQSDGKTLAFGAFTSYNGTSRPRIARINEDGSLDMTFVPDIQNVNTIALQPDGKVILGGTTIAVNGFSRTGAARLNANGTLDTAFDPAIGSPNIRTVLVQSDGKIVFGGTFSGVGGFPRSNLARLNSDGTADPAFDAGTIAAVNKVVQQSNGKYAVATTTLLRLNANGSADTSFQSPPISGAINDIVVESSGAIIAGGSFTAPRSHIARFGPSGTLDISFLPDGANNTVLALTRQPDGNIITAGQFTSIGNVARTGIARLLSAPFHENTPFDFDGDGRADISVTRTGSDYIWYQLLGPDYTFSQTPFGLTGDIVTPADFDGDGITDLAIFRAPSGDWWYRSSIDGIQRSVHWGSSGDIPLPGDIDGDGKADFVVYKPSNGIWYRLVNGQNTQLNVPFGAAGDKPLLADFDGDGKADPAIFRPSSGTFWYAASSAGGQHRAVQWGISTDVPVPSDYDGDGRTDFAVYRPSEGAWYVLQSSDGRLFAVQFGLSEDRPIPADYDGDGRADVAVYRPSDGTWYLLRTTSGFTGIQWGVSTDVPSPAAYIPQ